eukprot:IDg8242t1
MAASELPIGMQLEKVHKFLKDELRPLSSEDILKETGVDIDGTSEIHHSLTGKESKVVQEKDGRWRWRSAFYLRSRNDLFALLSQTPDGIVERKLLDSYKGVRDDLNKLKTRQVVYDIKAGNRTVLYPRDTRLETVVAPDVTKKYTSLRLPDAIEIHRYLVEHGVKDKADTAGVAVAVPVARKRPKRQMKRKARRIKLTNTHMANSGIDLNKDFKPGKDSAFG